MDNDLRVTGSEMESRVEVDSETTFNGAGYSERAVVADRDLAAALEAGDDALAMEILVKLHGEHVYRYCRRMLGNDADDISQTVYMQVFADLERLRHVHCTRAWLLGIARHRCLDHLKSIRRRPQFLDHDDLCAIADLHPAASIPATNPRLRQILDARLDDLDPRSRTVLVLRFHHDLSYEEIGALTSDTPGALRVRAVRALAALRRCFEST